MISFTKILGIGTLVLGALAAFFRAKSKQHQAEAREQKSRADSANEVIAQREDMDRRQARLNEKHQQENADAQAKHDRGDRDHLDRNW